MRIVFCLYAEDAGLFSTPTSFHDYLATFNPENAGMGLQTLFKVLNTEHRRTLPNPLLKDFPYVNGGLFADDDIEMPWFDDEIVKIILEDCSANFNWSQISPTIFGSIFESTLNPETRRSGGMHYTSIENIHKVIDPLFLDDLKNELEEIKEIKTLKNRKEKLLEYQNKLARLKFLDPACGSGNFLTESYICLRRLENEAIAQYYDTETGQKMLLTEDIIKVKINQFYGIEINDFAASVAKTALWIAESQMMSETESLSPGSQLNFLPLSKYENITEANALRIDWNTVVPKEELNYIMGNPPFIGGKLMNIAQKKDMLGTFGKEWKNLGNMDYVCCWFKRTAEYIKDTFVHSALVATNSISQGQAIASLLAPLMNNGIVINFAWKSFIWNSEATDNAHVHCVIIGFSYDKTYKPKIFDNERAYFAKNINAYLFDAENVVIDNRTKSICNVPEMDFGNMPNDGGNFLLTEEERRDIIAKEPQLEDLIKPFVGAREFINNKTRYCFWLTKATPQQIRNSAILHERIANVRRLRLASTAAPTREKANTPHLFFYISQPTTNYLLVPGASSQRREYLPIGFMPPTIIASNAVLIVPNASRYHFGVMTSSVHNAWMRTVCGRLKSDYRYSNKVVYNNFPWCDVTDAQRAEIEKTAQGILDARAKFPDSSLADLYDKLTMPPELRKAHKENDKAVLKAYGLKAGTTEEEIVAFLMKRYQKLTKQL